MNRLTGRIAKVLLVLTSGIIPAVVAWWLAPPPQDRHVHVEAFRYGKQPSVIRCGRGDRLHLTFSSRDTGHSFFLEEFDLDVKINPQSRQVAVFSTRNPEAPPQLTEEVIITAEPPGAFGWLVSKMQFRCHVWCGPLHAFEQGNLIIHPNLLLHLGLGFAVGVSLFFWIGFLPVANPTERSSTSYRPCENEQDCSILPKMAQPCSSGFQGVAEPNSEVFRQSDQKPTLNRIQDFTRWASLFLGRSGLRLAFLCVTGTAFYLVILTCLFGTKVAGRNFGTMFTWVVWLGLLICVLIPLCGRVWCPLCPIPILGDFLQQIRRFGSNGQGSQARELGLSWPRSISPAFSRVLILLVLGTFSTAIVAVPRVTGLVILGLVLVSVITSLVWKLRFFCVYLCPVAAFLSTYSPLAWLSFRPKERRICERCQVRSCQRGSLAGQACPYGLWGGQSDLTSECGLCLECVKTCPFNNMMLALSPQRELFTATSWGVAWSRIILLVLAVSYCLIHLGPWPQLRTTVDIVDKGERGLFGLFATLLWATALGVVPICLWILVWLGGVFAKRPLPRQKLMRESTAALLAPGLALWVTFAVHLVFVNASFVLQALSDPFGWGWNLLGMANTPWHQVFPAAIPWIQVMCLLVGHYHGLRTLQRVWTSTAGTDNVWAAFPLGLGLTGLTLGMVWFFAN
ncbi:MAG: hypothetical protein ACUVTH_14530 [Thermogutta sp.]